ncbi:MAG: asparaginase [Bacteroidales bacterium]|nr:asparaginase [Bacteroidales bacterium]
MSKILMIYTGGTIGMVRNPETGSLEAFTAENLAANIPEMKYCGAEVEMVSFGDPIDSSDMNPQHWGRIVKIISDNYDSYDGFVILHGTDTMAFTASALSFMLENIGKPVILTGSQLPVEIIRSDAKENLLTAIEIAAAKDADGHPVVPEVCIYFHDELMRGNRSSKISASNLAAFASNNYPVLAHSGTDITYHKEFIRPYDPSKTFTPHYNMDPSIIILSLFPGLQRDAVEAAMKSDAIGGVIFRTFGSGNAPRNGWLVNCLAEAVKNGKTIVNISQCATGSVEMERYETGRQLLEAGIVSGHDSTVEAALAKLMFLRGEGYSQAEIQRLMNTSIAGEVTV